MLVSYKDKLNPESLRERDALSSQGVGVGIGPPSKRILMMCVLLKGEGFFFSPQRKPLGIGWVHECIAICAGQKRKIEATDLCMGMWRGTAKISSHGTASCESISVNNMFMSIFKSNRASPRGADAT